MSGAPQRPLSSQSASLIDNVILATTSLFAPVPAASTAPPQTTNSAAAEDIGDDDRALPGEDATPSRPEDPRQKANGTPGPRTPGHDAVVAAISRIPSGGEERPMSPLPPMSPQMRDGSALQEIPPSGRTSAFTDEAVSRPVPESGAAQPQGIPPHPPVHEAPRSPVAPPPAQRKSAPMRPPLPDCFAPVITTIQTVVPSVLPSPQTAIVDEDAVLPCVPPSPKPQTAPVPEVPPELPEAPTTAPKSAVQMPPAPPLPPSAPTPTAKADEDTPMTVSALLARRARGKARALASEGAAPAPTQPAAVSPAAPAPVAVQAPTPAQQAPLGAPDGEKEAPRQHQQQQQQQPPPSAAPGSVLVPSAPKPLPVFPSSFIKSSPAAAFHALKPKAASTAAVATTAADDAPLMSTAELSGPRGNAPATAAAPAMLSPSDPAAAPAAAPASPPSAPLATTPEPSAALAPELLPPSPAVAVSTTGAGTAGESATRICRSCNGVVSGAFCPHCEGADLSRERGRRRSGSPPRRRDRRGADDDEDGYRGREDRGRRRRRSRTPRSPSPDDREARRDRRSDRRARERGRRMRGRRLRSRSRDRSMSTDSFASTASSASTLSSTSPEPSPVRGHEPLEQKRMKLRAIVEFGARKAAKAEARRAFQETMAKALRAAGEDPELGLPELSHEAKGFCDGAVGRTGRDFDHSAAEFARFWVDTVSVDGVDVPSVLLRETAGLSDESVTYKSRCEEDIELACPRGYDCPKIHFRDVAIRDVGRVSCGWYEPTIGLLKYAGSANLQGGLCRFHAPGALCQKGRLCSYLHRLDVTRVHAAQGASGRGAHADDTAPALDAPMAPAAKRTHSDPWADMVTIDGIAYPVTLLTSPAGDGARCPKGLECSTDMPCSHAHFKPISVKTLGVVSAGEFEPTDGLVHFTSRGTGKEAWLCRHFRESNRAACSNGHRCSFVHLRPDARVTKSDDPGKSGWLSAADMVPVDWTDSVIVDNVPFPRALLKPTAALQPSSTSAPIACARCPRDPHCPHAERCTKVHFKTLTVRSLGVASAGDFSVTMGLVHFATRFPERESYFCKDHGVQGRVCARGADCSFIHAVRSAPLASGAPAVMGHTEQAHVSLPSTITVDDVVYSRLLLLDTAGLMAFRGETDGGMKVGQRCPEDLHCTRGPSCPMIHFKPLTVRGNGVMSAGQFIPTQGLSHYTLRAPQKEAWVCRNYAPGRQCPAGNGCTFVHPREVTSIRGANTQGGAFGPDASAAAPVPQPIVAAAGSVMIEGFPYLPRLLSDTAGLRRAYALPSDLRARSDLRRCRFGLQCPRGADCDDIHFKQVLVKEIGPMSAGDCEPTVGLEKFVASQKEAWVCHHHGRRSGAPCSANEQCTFIHLRGMVPTVARPVAVPAPEPPMQAYHAGGHNLPSAPPPYTAPPQHAPRYASAPVAEPFEDPRPQRLPPHDEDAAVDDAAITAFGPARPSAVAEAALSATAPPPYAAPPSVGHRSVAPPVPQGHIPGMRPPPSYTQPAPPQYTRAVPAAPPRAEAQYGGRSFAQSAAAPHGASYDHSREPAMRPRDAEPQYVHGRGAEASAPPSEGHGRYVPRGSYSDAAGAYRPGDDDAVAAAPPRRGAYTHHPYDDKPQPPPPSYY